MRRVVGALLLLTFACGDGGSAADAGVDATPDAGNCPATDPSAPQTLCETGLYADIATGTLAPGVTEYQPQFELWADGATKRRFILLPEGETIDTSNMDFWVYPVGTKIWKEFSRDGVRVETRILWKRTANRDDWYAIAFVWDETQTAAVADPNGADDVLGTPHDVPARNDCQKCHNRQPDIVLGFSAIQLDHALGGLDLATLVADGTLSAPPAGSSPYFAVPGNDVEKAALGYLHGNCGGCHHQQSDVMDMTLVNLRLYTGNLGSVADTEIMATTVNVPQQLMVNGTTAIIEPQMPSASSLRVRMQTRGSGNVDMPPAGSEDPDPTGLAIIDAWIDLL